MFQEDNNTLTKKKKCCIKNNIVFKQGQELYGLTTFFFFKKLQLTGHQVTFLKLGSFLMAWTGIQASHSQASNFLFFRIRDELEIQDSTLLFNIIHGKIIRQKASKK